MIDEFIEFIKEREKIRYRKESGLPPPWTDDPILATGYFCNVRRDDDKVTRWLRKNWFEPHAGDEDLWFVSLVARNVNLIDTMAVLDYPAPWSSDAFLFRMAERQATGATLYNAAYMIRAARTEGLPKSHYLAKQVFTPAWTNRDLIRPKWGDSLNDFHTRLANLYGLGSFMAAQVVADSKPYGLLSDAPDWHSWCAPGPGSQRGLNTLNNRDLRAAWNPDVFREEVNELQKVVNKKLRFSPPLDAQDVQNTLCEWSKYYKAKYLGLRPRRKYNG